MSDLFIFHQTAPSGSDCTAPYKITLTRKCTVQDCINSILSGREWGVITVKGCGSIKYESGLLISPNFDDDILQKTVKSARCSGGWGAMDYNLHINE